MNIRPAVSDDFAAIRRIVAAAFGRSEEAAIVDGVREEGAALVELVAEDSGEIVGHILFSRMTCEPRRSVAALGPLAVAPERQGVGIGAALSGAGIDGCRALSIEAVVVLGHPTYYPRFGFSAAAASKVRSPYSGLPAFMALALRPGALDEPIDVAFPAAFGSPTPATARRPSSR